MKIYVKLLLVFSMLFCGTAFAQTDLSGKWRGKLALSPTESITIQFIFTKQADGSYKAVLNSIDSGGIKNVAADKVQFKDSRLSVEVRSLSGSFAGTMAKGVINGEWRQPGSNIPLSLKPFQEPTAGTLKPLMGSWVGKVSPNPSMTVTVVFRFETAKDGKTVGFLDIPDQNAKGIPVSDIVLDAGQVTFKVPPIKADYAGKLSGTAIAGNLKQGGQDMKLDLAKGKYVPPPPEVKIPPEAVKQMVGRWTGKIANLAIVFRFEQDAAGKIKVLMDSPNQKAKDIPVSSVVLTKDKLLLKVAAVFGEYNATLAGNKLDGTWTQGGKPSPLVLEKQ